MHNWYKISIFFSYQTTRKYYVITSVIKAQFFFSICQKNNVSKFSSLVYNTFQVEKNAYLNIYIHRQYFYKSTYSSTLLCTYFHFHFFSFPGPANIRMVSPNSSSPPLPMAMQVNI